MICKNCGANTPDASAFCKNCGNRIEKEPLVTQNQISNTQNVNQENYYQEHMQQFGRTPEKVKKKGSAKKVIAIICIILAFIGCVVGAFFGGIYFEKSKWENMTSVPINSNGLISTNKVEIGDYIEFGAYEQDNNSSNGKEPIEWLVLDKTDDKALVISKYALDCQPYNEEYEDITWEDCTLREWLNDDFLNSAFSSNERNKIPTVTVEAHDNPNYDTDPGNDTKDKVFLLSIDEAYDYFDSSDERECKPTAYAKAQGVWTNSDNGNCWWWLRSPGLGQNGAADVSNVGDVGSNGLNVVYGLFAVRPALWINLNS